MKRFALLLPLFAALCLIAPDADAQPLRRAAASSCANGQCSSAPEYQPIQFVQQKTTAQPAKKKDTGKTVTLPAPAKKDAVKVDKPAASEQLPPGVERFMIEGYRPEDLSPREKFTVSGAEIPAHAALEAFGDDKLIDDSGKRKLVITGTDDAKRAKAYGDFMADPKLADLRAIFHTYNLPMAKAVDRNGKQLYRARPGASNDVILVSMGPTGQVEKQQDGYSGPGDFAALRVSKDFDPTKVPAFTGGDLSWENFFANYPDAKWVLVILAAGAGIYFFQSQQVKP